MVFDNLAQLLALAFANPVLGMLAFLGVWSSSIVFCGLVFRGEDVVWPFRLFYYVMPSSGRSDPRATIFSCPATSRAPRRAFRRGYHVLRRHHGDVLLRGFLL